jgi:hypothetical protein
MKNRYAIVAACTLVAALAGCGRRRVETPANNTPPPTATATTATQAAPAGARVSPTNYAVQWVSNNAPSTMTGGASVPVTVTVKNSGDWPWPDPKTANPADPNGAYSVRLGYDWKKSDSPTAEQAAPRADLNATVPPGGSATFTINVTAPPKAGSYVLEFDLVEELVTWFSAKGTSKLAVPVTVK